MKLYDCKTAPSPRRVRIFLAEKGIEVPVVQVDLGAGEHLSEAFRKINPWCTVPVLALDDGTTISEVVAVCRYLEEAYPEPPLMGRDAKEMAVVAMWDHHFEIDGFLAVAETLRNASPRMQGRALPGPAEVAQIPALVERGKARVGRFFVALNERLGESEYVAGDQYTMADITAQVSVDFAAWIKLSPGDEHVHLRRWHERVSRRDSARA
jgi:glutathione S-transferase